MHPTSLIPGPTYITRFLHIDGQYAQQFDECEASLLTANIVQGFANVASSVRDNCRVLIIDPVTHAFTYQGFVEKPTYRNLPYAPTEPISATLLLQNPESLSQFTRSVLEFQHQNRTGVLIAPYFYARDLDDARLTANWRMIAEAASLREFISPELPLYAWVCVGSMIMQSPAQVSEVARLYHEQPVNGYFITVENFDDRYMSAESLLGLARFIEILREDKDVFPCSIASFGQVLTALGANGFSAGIGWLETFREVNLQPSRAGFAADRVPRAQYYYIPELLSYVHPDDLATIFSEEPGNETMRTNYMCDCDACASGLPNRADTERKKRHFITRRQREMQELSQVPSDERPQYIRDRLQLALELASVIEEEALVRIRTEHFVRWIAVVDTLTAYRTEEQTRDNSPDDLDSIIHETRQEPRDQGSS